MDSVMYERLCDQIDTLGYPGHALKLKLYDALREGKEQFTINPRPPLRYVYEDRVTFHLGYKKVGQEVVLASSLMAVDRVFPIEHGIYGGINTEDLEQLMKPVDWKIDYLAKENLQKTPTDHKLRQTMTRVLKIMNQLETLMLTGDQDAVRVAMQLQHRYFLPGPMGSETNLRQQLKENTRPLFHDFDMEKIPFTYHEQVNLLCGRSVRKRVYAVPGGIDWYWHKLQLDKRVAESSYGMQVFPDYDLNTVLAPLPYPEVNGSNRHSALENLRAGELLTILLNGPGEYQYLAADPGPRSVIFYDHFLYPQKAGGILPVSALLNQSPVNRPPPQVNRKHRKLRFTNFFRKGKGGPPA